MGRSVVETVIGAAVPTLRTDLAEALRPALCDADGCWSVDYVRLRLAAHIEGPR